MSNNFGIDEDYEFRSRLNWALSEGLISQRQLLDTFKLLDEPMIAGFRSGELLPGYNMRNSIMTLIAQHDFYRKHQRQIAAGASQLRRESWLAKNYREVLLGLALVVIIILVIWS